MPPISPSDLDAVLALFQDSAGHAADIARGYFRPGGRTSAKVDYKAGGSPVTQADIAVDVYLRETLCAALPSAAWLSEETADSDERLGRDHVLIVDPIDGTRGFLSGDARWTICIALVTAGRPTVGVVDAPMLNQRYAALAGRGAWCNGAPIGVGTRASLDDASIAGPGNFLQHFSQPVRFRVTPKIPSLAYRFVQVAAGVLDGCVAASDAHDWDIAAADLILHEAGGLITDRDGRAPVYNGASPTHPALVGGSPAMHRALTDLLRQASG